MYWDEYDEDDDYPEDEPSTDIVDDDQLSPGMAAWEASTPKTPETPEETEDCPF
jgi:hypothetical protein